MTPLVRELTAIRDNALDLVSRVDNVMKLMEDNGGKGLRKVKKEDIVPLLSEPSKLEEAVMANLYGKKKSA